MSTDDRDLQLSTAPQSFTSVETRSSFIVVVAEPKTASLDFHRLFSGYQWELLRGWILRAGIKLDQCVFRDLNDNSPIPPGVIVGLGENALRFFTDKRQIEKWHLSPLTTHSGQKYIPAFDLSRIQKQYELGSVQELVFRRALEESASPLYNRAPERFLLNPSLEETLAHLDFIKNQPEIAVDVETGYGQINTVGFAWSESDAIAVNVLPDRLSDENFYYLWTKIRDVLEAPSKKILQNFMYDISYFSAYGIRTANIAHDTMWAMKFLYPEFKSNLGNVGRFYTKRPYWKDDGKVTDEEGAKKDWGNVRDWEKHYLYNCRDTTGTLEASRAQRKDLQLRGLDLLFDNYLMELVGPLLEMCANGMPLDHNARGALKSEVEGRVKSALESIKTEVGFDLNPGSPKQKLKFLKEKGVKIPKKYDKKSGSYKESTDQSSLAKIKLKHPELTVIDHFLTYSSLNKALSSYIDFEVRPDGKLSYSLGQLTETLRLAGGTDPWDRGFNIQTIPREGGDVSIKQMFVAPEGWSFVEVDLRQAESRFVAYDSADATLIEMLESNHDVHRYVAAEIFKVSEKDVTKDQRQLGKKAGHGANYAMKEGVFIETCFAEMDLILTKEQAKNTLESYHRLFPGIRKWHAWIRNELWNKRKLSAPSGWERYFFSRYGDDMFKEAYAWRPQHTIPWITNKLMFHLTKERQKGNLLFKLLIQVHDALYLLVPDEKVRDVALVCLDHKAWSPEIILPGGKMYIPTEVKYGKCVADLEEWHE